MGVAWSPTEQKTDSQVDDSTRLAFPTFLIYPSCDGDAGLAQDVGNLRVAQTRSVVLEGELILLFVDAKPAKTIGIGEFAEAIKLLKAEWGLQFVGNFDQCHGRNYSSSCCLPGRRTEAL